MDAIRMLIREINGFYCLLFTQSVHLNQFAYCDVMFDNVYIVL